MDDWEYDYDCQIRISYCYRYHVITLGVRYVEVKLFLLFLYHVPTSRCHVEIILSLLLSYKYTQVSCRYQTFPTATTYSIMQLHTGVLSRSSFHYCYRSCNYTQVSCRDQAFITATNHVTTHRCHVEIKLSLLLQIM